MPLHLLQTLKLPNYQYCTATFYSANGGEHALTKCSKGVYRLEDKRDLDRELGSHILNKGILEPAFGDWTPCIFLPSH